MVHVLDIKAYFPVILLYCIFQDNKKHAAIVCLVKFSLVLHFALGKVLCNGSVLTFTA